MDEKLRFQRAAKLHGMSVSAWLKDCARDRLALQADGPSTVEELHAFFSRCNEMEQGSEPDWTEQKRLISSSRISGITDT